MFDNFFSYFNIEYGTKLNPKRSLQTPRGIKGTRQKVINPTEINQNQLLLVRFPNLGSDDVIVPGMTNLSFNIELSSTADPKRTLVNNIGKAIIKKLAVKFEGNEIMNIDDFDIFVCYRDLWKTKSEKRNAIRQGIIFNGSCTNNCIRLRINAGDKTLQSHKIMLLPTHTGISLSFLLTLKCYIVLYPITKRDSETNNVMKLHSTNTTESLNPW